MWGPEELPSEEDIARRLPRFEVTEPLGRGALGVVYKATDTLLKRSVAIKVMFAKAINPEFGERFLREATAMAKLNHPNIVTVHDYGIEDDLHYLVMEWVEGGSLEDEGVGHRKLPEPKALAFFDEICDALQYAHQQGVIHRDVKPSNILVSRDGHAKLCDFGIAKGMLGKDGAPDFSLTRTNMSVGTPLYMAPEQMKGSASVDHRADIYSAAAVLYEMLSAKSAKDRSADAGRAEGVPRSIGPAIDRALCESPEERYDRIDAFKGEVVGRQATVRSYIRVAAIAMVGVLLAVVSWLIGQSMANANVDGLRGYSEEAQRGLPLRSFEDEIDLEAWESIADYEFDGSWKDSNERQIDLASEGGAVMNDGKASFAEVADGISVVLSRTSTDPIKALAIHARLRIAEYLGKEGASNRLLSLTPRKSVSPRIVLGEPKWGVGRPNLFVGDGEPLAPQGVIASLLRPGEWHELWVVMDEAGYRVWIDETPAYRVEADDPAYGWKSWGEEQAELWVGGFRGEVDHLRILERP